MSMVETMTARARLMEGMRFMAESGSGHIVNMDASVEHGGADLGFRPMELLLVGLAGCTAMDVISILRKKRQDVRGYTAAASGVRAETNPMVFTEITVEHRVFGHEIDPEAVRRAIELSETRYCGAGAMLGKTARLTHTFRILEDDGSESGAQATESTLVTGGIR
jgi:putative redox protein